MVPTGHCELELENQNGHIRGRSRRAKEWLLFALPITKPDSRSSQLSDFGFCANLKIPKSRGFCFSYPEVRS